MSYLLIFIGLALLFFATSLRFIPSQPPHVAVVIRLGKRLRKVKGEGLRLFPLCPYLYNAILIDVSKKHQDLRNIPVHTPDLGEMTISASLTWTPLPTHAIEYLDHGGEPGIRTVLDNIGYAALRKWATASEGGPKDLEEALKTPHGTDEILIPMLVGLAPDLSMEERAENARRVRTGEGVPIPLLGITLNRLNIRTLQTSGVVAQTSEKIARVKKEIGAGSPEIRYLEEAIRSLKESTGVTNEQAIELLQTERGKVEKKIQELKIGVSPATLDTVMRVIDRFTGGRL